MLSYPNIDPVAFSLGSFSVHWYGIMYLFAFASAWLLGMYRAGKPNAAITRPQVENLITWAAFGVILGGRFGYVIFYHFDYFLDDPLWLFRIWEGGMSFHGGLLGVIAAMYFYARRIKVSYLTLMDFVAPLVPLGLAFGRLGNFIGQELWGRATTSSWGMVFPRDPDALSRHPSQLYQACLEGLLLFVIVFWFSAKPRPRGAVCGVFLIGYSVFRFIIEFFREPDAHIGFDWADFITRGQLLSLPLLFLGVGLLVWAYARPKTAQVKS